MPDEVWSCVRHDIKVSLADQMTNSTIPNICLFQSTSDRPIQERHSEIKLRARH
jgi:hypothetical protein